MPVSAWPVNVWTCTCLVVLLAMTTAAAGATQTGQAASASDPPTLEIQKSEGPDLLAIALNGQQVSAGSLAYVKDGRCLIQADSLRGLLTQKKLPEQIIDNEIFLQLEPPARCDRDDASGLLELYVPGSWLSERPLRLSNRVLPDPLPLLLGLPIADPTARIESLSAGHIDLVADPRRLHWAVGASHRGLQVFVTDDLSSRGSTKATLDWIWPSGAALRLGDQVTRQGAEQQPRAMRGLSFTNRLQVLRPSGLGQGEVALDAPARLQFFDSQGQPLFSTGLLPAGRYRLEGLGAPSLPGLLSVRVEGLSGQTDTILLPWVASPLLLAQGARQWDVWWGLLEDEQPQRPWDQRVGVEGVWARGLNGQETLRLGMGYETREAYRGYVGVSSQRWARVLLSADLGLACASKTCAPTAGLDISGQWRPGQQWSAGLRQQPLRQAPQALASPLPQASSAISQAARISVSHSIRPGTALTAQISHATTSLVLLGLQQRISPATSLQASLRSGAARTGIAPQTSFFLSLHVALPESSGSRGTRRRVTGSLQSGTGSTEPSAAISYQQSLGRSALDPQLSLVKAVGPNARQELRLQQASAWGDITLQARQPHGQPVALDASIASRLWVTPKGMHLGPVGDHNLVIHTLGHPDLRLELGKQSAVSNARGIVAFGRTPAWTEAQFKLDAQSIPFDLSWQTSQVRLPTAARRAYWVDQTPEIPRLQEFRLRASPAALSQLLRLNNNAGKTVAFSPEGYVDLHALHELPLTATLRSGQQLLCSASPLTTSAPQHPASVVWIICPGLVPEPQLRPPGVREALSSQSPISG